MSDRLKIDRILREYQPEEASKPQESAESTEGGDGSSAASAGSPSAPDNTANVEMYTKTVGSADVYDPDKIKEIEQSILKRPPQSHKHSNSNDRLVRLAAMAAGGILMCAGYLAAETMMYGSFALAIVGLPWNIGQVIVGMVLSMAIYSALAVSAKYK